MQIGDTTTVTREEAKLLRKQGYVPRSDLVVMMFVGLPDSSVRSNILAANVGRPRRTKKGWTAADHALADRKIAEAACR